jgi:hypothetical protein
VGEWHTEVCDELGCEYRTEVCLKASKSAAADTRTSVPSSKTTPPAITFSRDDADKLGTARRWRAVLGGSLSTLAARLFGHCSVT